ncbi:MAG: dihydrodipicolinate synthase family protein [Brachybacterium sp.]|nr:dihydrodipicolinate synthase family protein [Brachybacterium sp.]
MTSTPMDGVFAVATTPYREDGTVDPDRLISSTSRVLDAGVNGVLVLGATGEALALETKEQETVVRTVVEVVDGRVPVVAGAMHYRPQAVTEQIDRVRAWGASAAMVTPSFYGGLEADVAVRALAPVFAASELPLMLYNNPHSVGTDLLPHDLLPLQEHESFWSVKETSGAATRVRDLRNTLGETQQIFVGADGLALEGFTQGASGWVAASAWLLPQQCVALWRAADRGDWATAVELWSGLSGPLSAIEDNPAFISLIKQTLGRLGWEQGPVRPPLGTAAMEEVDALLAAISGI